MGELPSERCDYPITGQGKSSTLEGSVIGGVNYNSSAAGRGKAPGPGGEEGG